MTEMKEILFRLEEMEHRLKRMEGGAQEQKREKFRKI